MIGKGDVTVSVMSWACVVEAMVSQQYIQEASMTKK